MTTEPSPRRPLLSPLGVRLAAAFVTVALAAVAVLGILSIVAARDEVSDLVTDVHHDDARSAAAAAARAYQDAGGWNGADLSPAVAVAARGQATLALADVDGALIAAPADEAAEMMASMHGVEIVDVQRGDPVTEPVVVDGEQVGTVALRFPSSHLPTPERQARDAIARTIIAGGALAIAVAVIVAVFVARRVAVPITALTAAVTAVESGRRDVRVNRPDAPGELGALSNAFDRMAASVDREERLRRQLVADVAHEVRTPLTILRATTEGLVDGVLPPEQTTFESLQEEVLRLTQLVADLETLAAADAAGLAHRRVPIDLADIAGDAVEAIAPVASEQGLSVSRSLGSAPTHGDERRIHQIVANLLANAIRYTPTGGSIEVETGRLADGEAFVRVTNTGPGLSDDDLTHVFDRFYRGSASRGTEGSGVGLAIAAELAAAHGGQLTAANAPTSGASFMLTLPRAPSQSSTGSPESRELSL
jgi:two-component system sensor histidine kinase BaeS